MAVDLSMSVLVVDDYNTMIRIIRNLLKQLGFEHIDDASDGSMALEKMRGKKYGLVISDWNMEPMTGYDLLKEVQSTSEMAAIHYIRQTYPLGLGHAVRAAKEHVGDEPFAVLLGDDIMVDDATLLRSMIDVYNHYGRSVVALKEVTLEEISAYGAAEQEPVEDGLVRVRSVVEKPRPEDAPSTLAVIGRYVFTPEIFDAIDHIEPGAGGELQLTDAIGLLLESQTVYGRTFSEGRYDIGQKVDFLRANIELALDRPDIGPELQEFLVDLVRRRNLL